MERIVLIGASGHASVIADLIEKEARYEIVGLIDSFKPAGTWQFGYPIIGSEEELTDLCDKFDFSAGLVAIGENWTRFQVAEKIRARVPGFRLVTAIHPSAQIAGGVEVGDGTVVMAGSIINSNSKVGACCIVNTKASLDHDCSLGDYASLCPGATIGGNVAIGECSFVGLGANVIHNIKIGSHSVVAAGATVIRDVADETVVQGTPALAVRSRKRHEKVL